MPRPTRRSFLQTAAASSAVLGLGELSFLNTLAPVSAAEAQLDPNIVRLSDDIEPLVRLIEETPREKLLEEVGQRIRNGTSYREVLAALLLAGVRNVQPRPSVGFKFHAVLVVNSAHLASLASPDNERWLPIFWALDYFKSAQARDVREGNWTMGPVDEAKVPPAHRARAAFIEAMDNWDEAAADVAVASLARHHGANDVYELFFKYGGRDYRSIGHKAIFVANSFRTLNAIGWRYAEPVLRSLAYALLMHEGGNPAKRDDRADRAGRRNAELAKSINKNWLAGKLEPSATTDLLSTLREGDEEAAAQQTVKLLNAGVAPQSIWDAAFDGSGELLLRQPGIVALHAATTTNALHFAYQRAADDETRRWLLLQNASFLTLFRESLGGRGRVGDQKIDALEPEKVEEKGDAALDAIFAQMGRRGDDRRTAARQTLGYLQSGGSATKLIDHARRMVFMKGNDAHDYKFSSAVLEDYHHVSPKWRDTFLASSMMLLCGGAERDNGLIDRARAAMAG